MTETGGVIKLAEEWRLRASHIVDWPNCYECEDTGVVVFQQKLGGTCALAKPSMNGPSLVVTARNFRMASRKLCCARWRSRRRRRSTATNAELRQPNGNA
jgi:hypothetical protein